MPRFGVDPYQHGVFPCCPQILLHVGRVLEGVVGNHPVVMVTGEEEQGGEIPACGNVVDWRVPGEGNFEL